MGTGLVSAPSASRRPLSITGVMTVGIAIEARMATSTRPFWNHTSLRARRSVATAVNAMGRSSISTPARSSRTRARILSARIAPGADSDTSSSLTTSRWRRPRTHSAYGSSVPAACSPPTRAPMDEPAMLTISKPRSSSTSITPMWA